jgi:queuine tRNA-ribosyltransferase
MLRFEIIHQSSRSRARVGRIHTPHGVIETPNFVPVATHGAIKAVDSLFVQQLDLQLVFCNTYHLMLHPGADVIARAGGIHTFMRRNAPLITDSGGFQIFSLAYGGVHAELKSKGKRQENNGVVRVTEEGVTFRSYRDGKLITLTPESSVEAQKKIGADIILPLDELLPYHTSVEQLQLSFERTHRWQKRSLAAHCADQRGQAMYGIVHGGVDPVLRKRSIELLADLPFDGFAIGGSLGKNCPEMLVMLEQLMPHVPQELPVHLLGIGDLPSLAGAIPLGIDTFDSAYPSRNARHGLILTRQGPLNITRGKHESAYIPLDDACQCVVCTHHTRAYVHHLFKAHELSAFTLATLHNLQYMVDLMKSYREQILRDEV